MLYDLNTAAAPDAKPFDVCVIGAGPAGISLALELARRNKRVALCEGGGFEWSEESQNLYQGSVVGDPYFDLHAARLRFFGGTSGHWTGWCHQLEEIDFARKDKISVLAHWPIQKKDLDPYLAAACALLEIKPPPPSRLLSRAQGVREIFFGYSPPTRFGETYRKRVVDSKNIALLLNANLIDVKATNGKVSSATFRSYSGKQATVSANKFVFAMGGIENSRQLLWQNAKNGGGLYARDLPVGRYWMEHPHFTVGGALVDFKVTTERRFFGLTPAKQTQLGILNCGLRLEPISPSATRKMVKDLICVAPAVGKWAADLAGKDLVCGVKMRAAWEQAPAYDNRVGLSAKKDRFGAPTATLHWRKGELDRKTIQRTTAQFNEWLMARKFGRLQLESWVLGRAPYPTKDELGGYHHMGGTRMAASPSYGVVDSNCRVFGSQNLYVAGSSVFPSGGHANPTLSIVQLALRLANHIAA